MPPRLSSSLAVLAYGGLIVLPALAEIQIMPDAIKPAVEDKQRPLEPNQVKLTGMLGERIGLAEKNRLLTVDEDLLLDGFRKRPGEHPWIGEHVGKWMHAATLIWVYTGDEKLKEKIDRVAAGLMATQMPDGYLGTYLEKDRWTSWDVWSHKYDLMGLLTYYRYTGNPQALETCKRVGDLLCNTFGKDKRDIIKAGEHVGMAATSVLEPMVLLYRATGDPKYLDFCHYILWAWEQPHGPKILSTLAAGKGVNKVANGKAYEMLSNLVGLCELYRATGEQELLPPVLHAWDDIVKNRLYISGSASQHEHFRDDGYLPNDGKQNIMETCVTVTWMQLNAQLLRLTDEPKFADQLERTVYNQLLFAQKPDGSDFCYYNPLEGQREWKPLGKREVHCCLSSGPRGLALIPTFIFGVNSSGAVINFYEAGEANLVLVDGTEVKIEQQTEYPFSGEMQIAIHPQKSARFAVQLRAPAWCVPSALSFTIRASDRSSDDERRALERRNPPGRKEPVWFSTKQRTWQAGDRVMIKSEMPIRAVAGFGTNKGKVAVTRGPLVLAADEKLDADLKPLTGVSLPLGSPEPASEASSDDKTYSIHACAGPEGHTQKPLKMIPLALAGNDNVWYQVWFNQAEPNCGQ